MVSDENKGADDAMLDVNQALILLYSRAKTWVPVPLLITTFVLTLGSSSAPLIAHNAD